MNLVAALAVVFMPETATTHRILAQYFERGGSVIEIDEGCLHRKGGDQATHQQLALDEVHGRRG
jgi:hypothetical protein